MLYNFFLNNFKNIRTWRHISDLGIWRHVLYFWKGHVKISWKTRPLFYLKYLSYYQKWPILCGTCYQGCGAKTSCQTTWKKSGRHSVWWILDYWTKENRFEKSSTEKCLFFKYNMLFIVYANITTFESPSQKTIKSDNWSSVRELKWLGRGGHRQLTLGEYSYPSRG